LLFLPGFAGPSHAQHGSIHPKCSAVYRDTLFFGGQPDRKNPTSPLIAVGDGLGRPFESSLEIQAPWGMGGISHMVVFQGDMVVCGKIAKSGQDISDTRLFKYDGLWMPFQVQPPGSPLHITDILVSDGVLYLAGRFRDPETGITENVLAFDGRQWHKLGLRHGSQHITRLCEYKGMVIAASGCRSSGLNDDYIRRTILAYTISKWDGSSWITLKEGKGGMPKGLTDFEGRLYVGFFTMADAGTHPSVLKFDGNKWSPEVGSFQNVAWNDFVTVGALDSYRGRLIAVGKFDSVDGFQAPGAAYKDGETWRPLGFEVKGWPGCLSAFDQNLWVGQIPRTDSPGLIFWNEEIPVDASLELIVPTNIPTPRQRPEVVPFRNGDFSVRENGLPVGWTFDLGPLASYIKPSNDPHPKEESDTLSYSLDGGVLVPPYTRQGPMRSLVQKFPAEKDQIYRARVRARIAHKGARVQAPARFHLSVGSAWDRLEISEENYQWYELELPGTDRSFSGKVRFTGCQGEGFLEITEVQLEELDADYSTIFETFCQGFSDQYANLEFAPVVWDSLVIEWRPIAAKAKNCVAFQNIILKMLAELNDPKLVIETRNSDVTTMRQTTDDEAEEARRWALQKHAKPLYRGSPLRDGVQKPPEAEFIDVDGYQVFYMSVWSALQKLNGESAPEFQKEVAKAEGILLDLRHFQSHRKWPKFKKSFLSNFPKVPTIALIDPTTRGAGADVAIALKNQTGVTFVGQETGTPSQIMGELRVACGFLVHLPSHQVKLSDGSIVNGRFGLIPDIPVEEKWETEKDEIMEGGLQVLRQELGK
jgi:Peptidase family S41